MASPKIFAILAISVLVVMGFLVARALNAAFPYSYEAVGLVVGWVAPDIWRSRA